MDWQKEKGELKYCKINKWSEHSLKLQKRSWTEITEYEKSNWKHWQNNNNKKKLAWLRKIFQEANVNNEKRFKIFTTLTKDIKATKLPTLSKYYKKLESISQYIFLMMNIKLY